MDSIQELLNSLPFLTVISAILSYVMATRCNLYPVIINVSKIKGLMDEPGERRVHSDRVPNLGGMGLFITFSLTLLLFVGFLNSSVTELSYLLSMLSATIILLFLGIKDDLVLITAKKKFVIQLIAVSMVCVIQDVRITDFNGLLGIGQLPYLVSVIFTIFVFVLVINSVNLIDGIDGLAASIAILASLFFGIAFFMVDNYMMTLISAILIGSLFGFLKYNFSIENKIFMGDCGSLIVGFLLAYQGVMFLNIIPDTISSYNALNSPVLLLAILSYPLFDLLRVFIVRIWQKRSPFDADSNHIHHRLLRLGLSHKQATLLLFTSNLTLIIITYFTNELPINMHLMMVVSFGCLLYLLPFLSVFEEYKEPELVVELKKAKEQANLQNGVLPLWNHKNSNGIKSEIEDNSNQIAIKRSRKFKFLNSKENASANDNANKVPIGSNHMNLDQ